MTTETTAAAPQNTEQQLVGQTFTLWLWPHFCLREEARPVVSGLTKAKADEIMEREKDRAPGVMFLEPDDTLQDIVRQIRVEMQHPKSERVLQCQSGLKAAGCPAEKPEEATIECLLPNDTAHLRAVASNVQQIVGD